MLHVLRWSMADAERTVRNCLRWLDACRLTFRAEKISCGDLLYIIRWELPDNVCRAEINRYYDEAMACLDQVSVSEERKANLKNYLLSLMERNL